MNADLEDLLANNRRWAEATERREPGFFTRLAQQQTPVMTMNRSRGSFTVMSFRLCSRAPFTIIDFIGWAAL